MNSVAIAGLGSTRFGRRVAECSCNSSDMTRQTLSDEFVLSTSAYRSDDSRRESSRLREYSSVFHSFMGQSHVLGECVASSLIAEGQTGHICGSRCAGIGRFAGYRCTRCCGVLHLATGALRQISFNTIAYDDLVALIMLRSVVRVHP